MNNRVPQIIKRRIGAVDILDLRGLFVGPWALRGREEIALFIKKHRTKNLLVNLRGLETLDSLGVKAITENLIEGIRGGLVVGNLSVMEMFARVKPRTDLKFFRTEEEIIHYFGPDLVKWEEKGIEEKRKYPRLNTALPLEFSYDDDKGEKVFFRAVVTDMSEGGLYAEYLDLEEASMGRMKLNPYDFKVLDLTIRMPEGGEIRAQGKVVRMVLEAEQVGMGIEFYEISDQDRVRILNFFR